MGNECYGVMRIYPGGLKEMVEHVYPSYEAAEHYADVVGNLPDDYTGIVYNVVKIGEQYAR